MDKFIIIDGNSIAYRAFYALPALANKNGVYTNAVYGFLNMFFKIVDEQKPTHMAVVFDFPAKTFRNNLFKDYKATRKPMPEELKSQMPVIKTLLKEMGAFVIEKEGFEADDIVGTLAKKFEIPTVIITGDRDCLQLIDTSTKVLLTKRGLTDVVEMNLQTFFDSYGFKPEGIIELKSLMGDASDNIPGVKGIGEKGAMNLVQKYGTLEAIYENINSISGKMQNLLLEQKNMAELSHELATINTKIEIETTQKDVEFSLVLDEKVKKELEKLELFSIIKRRNFSYSENAKQEKDFEEKIISNEDDVAVLNVPKGEIALVFLPDKIEIANDEQTNYVIQIKKDLLSEGVDFKTAIMLIKPILENNNILKICFNYNEDKALLKDFDVRLTGLDFDVHIANWLLNSNYVSTNLGEVLEGLNLNNVSAVSIFKAKRILEEKLKEENLYKLYIDLELPLVDVLFDMQEDGIKVSCEKLEEILAEYEEKQKKLIKEIYDFAGQEFNINSPKQLATVLFDNLGLPGGKKKSTAVNVLVALQPKHEIVGKILEYRTITKIISTYLVVFKSHIKNGFINTTFNQTGTATGRLSSSNPNLQNIPVKKEKGKFLRKMFVSRFDGGKIVSADYNQIELRLVANLSKDEKMIEAFLSGKDIHKMTASQIFNIPLDEVTSAKRQEAKAVNFGIVYGISAYGLSEQIGGSAKVAADYIDKYYKAYPGIKTYMDSVIKTAKENGGVATSIFGRKRKVDEILAEGFQAKQFGERAVMNMPFQGSASDIIKFAMIRVSRKLKELKLKSKLILQIHDELIVDACEDEVEKVKQILKEEMEGVVSFPVPLTVDIECGNSWFEV